MSVASTTDPLFIFELSSDGRLTKLWSKKSWRMRICRYAADFLPQMLSEKQFSCRRERWLTCCFCIVRMEAEQGGTTTGIVIRSFLWTCWLFCCVFEPLFPAGVSLGWREQTGRVAEVLAGLLRAARLKNPALMKPSNVSCIQVWCMRMERRHASTRPVRSAQPRDTRCGCWGK